MPPPVVVGKLIRDKIPDIVYAKGDVIQTRELLPAERLAYLQAKLFEEAEELLDARRKEHITEEIADIVEVLHAIAKHQGIVWTAVESAGKEKRQLRGAFKRFICLLTTGSRK